MGNFGVAVVIMDNNFCNTVCIMHVCEQLVKLRHTIGRMLGLNVGPATSADFEIVSRLEKLIMANKNNLASTVPVDASFEELANAFKQGQGKHRSRSRSPARKRDTKVY